MDSTIIAAIIGAAATIIGILITYLLTSKQEDKKRKNELQDLSQKKDIELANLKEINEIELTKLKEQHKNDIEKIEMKNAHDIELLRVQYQSEVDKEGKVKEQDLVNEFAGDYMREFMKDKSNPLIQQLDAQMKRQFLKNK